MVEKVLIRYLTINHDTMAQPGTQWHTMAQLLFHIKIVAF